MHGYDSGNWHNTGYAYGNAGLLEPFDVGLVAGPGIYDDTGGFFSSIVSAVSSVARAVAAPVKAVVNVAAQGTHLLQEGLKKVTDNPLWDIAKTGISFIPGVGTAVSAGMSTVAALGHGKSLKDTVLAAARGAIPGGPAVIAAFDVAHGLVDGKNVTESVLQAVRQQVPGGDAGKAAFDAGLAIAKGHGLDQVALAEIRKRVPAAGMQAFNAAITQYQKAHQLIGTKGLPVRFPGLSLAANRVAVAMQHNPALLRTPARVVAQHLSAPVDNVRAGIASMVNMLKGQEIYDWRDVGEMDSAETCCAREDIPMYESGDTGFYQGDSYDTGAMPMARVVLNKPLLQALYRSGSTNVKKALLAHGLLARIHHATGELDGGGGWIVRSGETGSGIAKKLTGDANRWREILGANPKLKTTGSGTSVQITPWFPGQRITIPASWLGTAAPSMPSIVIPGIPGATALPTTTSMATVSMNGNNSGPAVVAWQNVLLRDKASIPGITITTADGQFGPMTDASTKAWQRARGLTADGVVGPQTWAKAMASGVQMPLPQAIPVPSRPAPMPSVPSSSTMPSTAAIQALLTSFYQFHGTEVALGDFATSSPTGGTFGADITDLSGTWNKRSEQAMLGFQNWRNAHPVAGGTPIPETGQPDQLSVNALQAQALKDLQGVSPVPIPIPQLPTSSTIPELPGNVPLPNVLPVGFPGAPGSGMGVPVGGGLGVPGITPPSSSPPVVSKAGVGGGGGDLGPLLALAALGLVGMSMAGNKRAA